ncbi:MAG: hypothetical protein HQL86_01215 [Magnetococcales bacterium]|nr:hypothetical protein [Magnetococcales bacterium]
MDVIGALRGKAAAMDAKRVAAQLLRMQGMIEAESWDEAQEAYQKLLKVAATLLDHP